MPAAIPIILGAVSVSSGVAAMGAAIGLAATVSAGAMIAGGAMMAIGGLSGSKKMQKFGGIIGLAGGVGTLVSNMASDGAVAGAAKSTGKVVDVAKTSPVSGAISGTNKAADSLLSSAPKLPDLTLAGGATPDVVPGFSSAASTMNIGEVPPPPGMLNSLESTLNKYKNITKIAGYMGQGYQDYQNNQIKNNYYQGALDLKNRQYADSVKNINAKFNVNIRPVTPKPGMLYKGIKQNPLPMRRVVQPAGVTL